jgi:alpha-ketoglutaric semialdehyde dehydrogenase
MTTALEFNNLVGGQWADSSTGSRLEVTNPADWREVVASVPAMAPADVQATIAAAEAAARSWRRAGRLERAGVLAACAGLLRQRADAIATDLVREMGKTIGEARVEVAKSADFFDFYASLARWPYGYLTADARPGTQTSVRREPIGVVVAITPWNDPLLTPARKLAPSLAAGNAVLLKPALETPVVALHLARALVDAGLPPGVLNTVTGETSVIAGPLLLDPRLAAVTFTGSTAVGRHLRRLLGDSNVRLQTEMGGKNPSVVLADADLDLAAATIVAAALGQAGERCTATSRVIAEQAVAAELTERLVGLAAACRLGPGLAEGTTMGPLVSSEHREAVLGHIAQAEHDGARVLAGGRAPQGDQFAYGHFVEPTIMTAVTPDMAIWRNEVFGPVFTVTEVADFEQAVAAANDSGYGLAAAVFTRDLERAHRFIDEVDAGQVSVNLPTSGWDVHHPFGGFGDSGSPFKEQGLEGLQFYTRVKTAAIRFGR